MNCAPMIGPTTNRIHALIVIPPFAGIDRASLGAHTLQAVAKHAGYRVSILYANLLMASRIGVSRYTALSRLSRGALLCDRLFVRAAYGLPALGHDWASIAEQMFPLNLDGLEDPITAAEYENFERCLLDLVETIASQIVESQVAVVGCSTTFEQTAAAMAILRRVKDLAPATTTILGGANCEGEMGRGLADIADWVDHVFSGESEKTFSGFLKAHEMGDAIPRVIEGKPLTAMDDLPCPNYEDFYAQLKQFLGDDGERSWLPFETSRGCWWGQKHHCTFCGLNGEGMGFRQKSTAKVQAELSQLTAYPSRKIAMADNIMPRPYFRKLLPWLKAIGAPFSIFYEQKANMHLDQVQALVEAGIHSIQPGIEALSTELLRRMDKGVSAYQNIALLRYARACNLDVQWNLLLGFPGDSRQAYLETLERIKVMRHLQPPGGTFALSIDRFSPYFTKGASYGIHNRRPLPAYRHLLPNGAPVERIAYHFLADYPSAVFTDPTLQKQLEAEVNTWQVAWQANQVPMLWMERLDEFYVVLDTRGVPGLESTSVWEPHEAQAFMVSRPFQPGGILERAVDAKLGIVVDGRYVPLVGAHPDLLHSFEAWSNTNSVQSIA